MRLGRLLYKRSIPLLSLFQSQPLAVARVSPQLVDQKACCSPVRVPSIVSRKSCSRSISTTASPNPQPLIRNTSKMTTERQTAADPNTLSNYQSVVTTQLHLDLTTDFEQRTLKGFVELKLTAKTDDLKEVILDTRALVVESVSIKENASADWVSISTFELAAKPHEAFGAALKIVLPNPVSASQSFALRVSYKTTPESSALCWLAKEQTDGGNHPYLFSQCQAIHARAMVPCQDTPGVRAPYSAVIRCPKELTALMSALSKTTSVENELKVYEFDQPVDVPSYLIALVVGDLAKREISGRCAVWSEPARVEAAANEFAEMESYLKIAESICGPYIWGRYDVLVLPGSFPYGGMENPCLTFATPTLLAGDRSLVDVIAHEITHSWTGNLVGVANWEDFWLNEGFTMFIERMIMSQVHGEEFFDFDAIIGWSALREEVKRRGAEDPFTCLRPNLTNVDPDDAFGTVPYEKGFNLLYFLARKVGGREKFHAWLRTYLDAFQHKPITSTMFKDHFVAHFGAAVEDVDWVAWFDKPGMPPYDPAFSTSVSDRSVNLAKLWMESPNERTKSEVDGWTTKQYCCFFDHLLEHHKEIASPVATMEQMDRVLQFTKAKNAEVLFRWLSLCLKTGFENASVIMALRKFITVQGRMKFVRPLYRLYSETDPAAARALFLSHKVRYHSIAQKMIAKDLKL